jgi:PAS domain S-box-containing protein
MYTLLERNALRRAESFFHERVAEAQAAINVRMSHYIDALRGGAGFFAASERIDRDEWRLYTESLDLRQRYPGINGLGIILAVRPDGIEAWKEHARLSGEPNPVIRPFPATTDIAASEPKFLITVVESLPADRPPIGRNIATEPSRRRAAELARDTGQPHINQRIPGSRDTQRRAGLLLYVPLYSRGAPLATVAERRAAHLGWVYAQVFPDVFLDGVLGPIRDTLHLHFFEAGGLTPEKLMHASEHPITQPLPEFERVTEITLAGEPFLLGWRRGPKFPAVEKSPALWVAGSLGVATLLLAGLVTSLQSVGRRARAIASARTAELGASEERFRHAFEFAGIGMALVALDGRVLRVNQSLCEILGYSQPRLLQKRFHDITHPDDLAPDLALLTELLEGRRRFYQLEKRCIHSEGHSVWLRVTTSLVRDAAGAPLYGISQVEDITERKRLETSLASARDRAMEDSQFKSQFLVTMVDEIRIPANEVADAASRLRNRLVTLDKADYVRELESSGTVFRSVLNDILDYSNLEAGGIKLEITVFNLRDCVHEALAAVEERARVKQLKLLAVIAPGAPQHVAGDPRRLKQILVNLLGKAIQVMDAGDVRVSLTAEALDATTGHQRLKFAVRDTGSRAVGDSLQRPGGGVGLAISQRVAEMMNGTMWTESEPGRGTTFHFTVSIEPRDTTINSG